MTKIVDEPIIGTSKNLRGNVDVHNMQMDFQNSLPTCQMQINAVIEKKSINGENGLFFVFFVAWQV